jgi:hypothetical protein
MNAFGNTINLGMLIFSYFDLLIVDKSFGGLRPIKGCCSMSTTCPLIGPLSSLSQYTTAAAISEGHKILPAGAYTDGKSLYQSSARP